MKFEFNARRVREIEQKYGNQSVVNIIGGEMTTQRITDFIRVAGVREDGQVGGITADQASDELDRVLEAEQTTVQELTVDVMDGLMARGFLPKMDTETIREAVRNPEM